MEEELVQWLRSRANSSSAVPRGIGDDAAILSPSSGAELCVTTDMLMDRVDFLWDRHEPALIGRKCLGVNLSDLAAMAARPTAAFVSLAIPKSTSLECIQQLMEGMIALAAEFGVVIAGGDTNTHDGPLVVSVTAMGETPIGRAWTREGANPGDRILVTGPLGGSILGRQFTFTPRVREALAWREAAQVTAAIDISDGFGLDLSRLLSASGLGAIIQAARLPLSDAAIEMSRSEGSEKSPLQHALGDGEDFELILTAAPDEAQKLLRFSKERGMTLIDVGETTAERNLWLEESDGRRVPLPASGFRHELAP
jgi:thiamine-monophosphate kinase